MEGEEMLISSEKEVGAHKGAPVRSRLFFNANKDLFHPKEEHIEDTPIIAEVKP